MNFYKIVQKDKRDGTVRKTRLYQSQEAFERWWKKLRTNDVFKCYDWEAYSLAVDQGEDLWERLPSS